MTATPASGSHHTPSGDLVNGDSMAFANGSSPSIGHDEAPTPVHIDYVSVY